jgi:putative nucleotidyltransferase with HDIG domain
MPRIEYIKRITQSLLNLPTLPTVAARLLELVGEAHVDETALANVISEDPVLAARLLRLCHASSGQPVTGIRAAIRTLGYDQVRDISLEASMIHVFSTARTVGGFDLQQFWDHCSSVGVVARFLAQKLQPESASEAFTAGLLHDIGKVVLLQYLEADFAQAIDMGRRQGIELWEAERELLGVDHGQIGAWLAEHWRLPRSLQETMLYHHDLERARIDHEIVAMVAFADLLCRILHAGDGGNAAKPVFTPALSRQLQQWGWSARLESLEPLLFELMQELNQRNLTHYDLSKHRF